MKKFLLGIAVFITTAILCIVSAGAETYGDYEYTVLDDGTVEITKYNGNSECLNIPSKIYGKTVTSIGNYAFFENSAFTCVSIPDSVTNIGGASFYGCAKLESITVPEGVTDIIEYTFAECRSLSTVNLPDSLTNISHCAFYNCYALSSINIPNNIESIGTEAFFCCLSLSTFTIPENLSSIDESVFAGCTSLTAITVNPNNKNYISVNGVLFNKNKSEILAYPAGSPAKSYKIPDSVTYIHDYAFSACDALESITIPDSVKDIGHAAFSLSTSLKSLSIPDGITTIKEFVFAGCTSLSSIIISDSVTSIGDHAFNECSSLTSIDIPNSITNIGTGCFGNCTSLSSVSIPDSIISIGELTFENTAILNEQTTDIKYIDGWLISCKDLSYVNIKDGTRAIAIGAFSNCPSLTSITIPDTVKIIDKLAFYNCENLLSLTLPNGIERIHDGAFYNCYSLESISIPDSVTYIGTATFYNCTALRSVTIPEKVTSIEQTTFCCCTSLEAVDIPDGITKIGEGAFYSCESLKSIDIPDNVTQIDKYAFYYCTSLISVTIPEGVDFIDDMTFAWCISLSSVTIKNSEAYIVDKAFENCNKKLVFNVCIHSDAEKYAINNGYNYNHFLASIKKLKIGRDSFSHLVLEWVSIPYADGYIIEQYTDDKWVRIAKITSNATTTYCVTGLAAGTAYKFRMRAYVMDGTKALYSDYTPTLSTRTNPSNIASFKLGGRANNALRLNWTKNTSADGYIIEQYNGSKWVRVAKIASNATTTYRVTGLKAGTAYKFRMRAYKMDGTKALYSAYTSTLSARTSPSNVTGFKLGGRAADALRLNWTKNTSADGYIVEQYKSGKWVRIAKITSNATTTYKITGLKASTQYKFRVRAYKMSGKTALYSGYTSTLSAYTNPSKVANLKITGKATTALRLGWSKNTSADGYIVEMYKDGKWVRAAKITSNATVTFRKSGLKKGTTYKFRVRTYNMVGKTALYGNYVNVSGTTNK